MKHQKIEARFVEARQRWKATLLTHRRLSAYGSDAEDATFYLCKVLKVPDGHCRLVAKAKDRIVFEIEVPTELVDTQAD